MGATKRLMWLSMALVAGCTRAEPEDTGEPPPPVDQDGDGFFSDVDCDDGNAAVYPGATEYCDGVDEDCDGVVDGNVRLVWYRDVDGDGFGTLAERAEACEAPAGFALLPTDCDDSNPAVSPAAAEIPYNGMDDDCDPSTPDDDLDGDGVPVAEDCADLDAGVSPDLEELPYNGVDDDCDPATRDDDVDGDGFVLAEDCDDADEEVYPGALERLWDDVDQDCDGGADTTPWVDLGVEYAAMEGPLWGADQFGVALVALVSRDGGPEAQMPGVIWDWSDGPGLPVMSPIWADSMLWSPAETWTDYPQPARAASGLTVSTGEQHLIAGFFSPHQREGSILGVSLARTGYADVGFGIRWRFSWGAFQNDFVFPAWSDVGERTPAIAQGLTGGAAITACSSIRTTIAIFEHYESYTSRGGVLKRTSRTGDDCWPVAEPDGSWRAVRYNDGRFYLERPILGPVDQTLEPDGELHWPSLTVVGRRLERGALALWTDDEVLWLSRDMAPPAPRMRAADTRSRTDHAVLRASASGEGESVYVGAIVADRDGDTLPELVLAYGHWNGRLRDIVLPTSTPGAVEVAAEVSVLAHGDELWVSGRWANLFDGRPRAAWVRYRVDQRE